MRFFNHIIFVLIFAGSLAMTAQTENPFTQIQKDPSYQQVMDQDIPTRDQVITDDLIVQFSICVGSDCVNNENFGSDTFRLKENNLRIHFEDTSNSASFPTNDWRLTANDMDNGGDNYFSIDDATAGTQVFRVDAGAGANALRILDNGNVGFGTDTPVVEMHSVNGDTPTLRLDQDGSSGFTPQIWDIAGNEANFFVRDVTNGSNLPFRIRPGSGNDNALVINGDGAIGIGTDSPAADASLDLNDTTRGLLLNRLTTAERTAFTPSEAGMIVFDTDLGAIYTWNGTEWLGVEPNTDNQTTDVFQLNASNELELSLEDDGVDTQTVDLSSLLDNTDNQVVDVFQINGSNLLELSLEDDGVANQTVDLSNFLDNTDDQGADIFQLNAGNQLELSLEDDGVATQTVDLTGFLDNTDDQALTLNGNSLDLEDGGSVDLSGYLDNTDNQDINGSGLNGTTLTIGISGGASETVDLSALDNSGSDDQTLILNGNTLTLEDGGDVDLSGYLDNTDEQTLGNFIFTNNILGISLENGGSVQVDLTPLITPLQDDLAAAEAEIDNLNIQMADVLARLEAIEECACDGTLGVDNFNLQPEQPILFQNIPNPFDNTTTINYYIPFRYESANIVVSATSGRIMENKNITKMGEGSIVVNKARMQSAVYFYTLYVDGKRIDTKRMVVE